MQDIIKAMKQEAEVLEERANFYANHVPKNVDLHSLRDFRAKGEMLQDVAWCKREAALRLERSHG